jgi:two-component system sensor histidine kinase YcbA
MITNYSPLLSVFNNLIINAIDAILYDGKIVLNIYEDPDYLIINIFDNGSGIKEKNLDAIFQPGFSTKFQRKTGKMSTGIGLTHVKHIVERTFQGDLKVLSKVNEETLFVLKLNKKRLCQEVEDE